MKNISGGDNLAAYIGVDTKTTKKSKKEETEVISFDEEKINWHDQLSKLIANVEKSYESQPLKEKYDFHSSLLIAKNCVQ